MAVASVPAAGLAYRGVYMGRVPPVSGIRRRLQDQEGGAQKGNNTAIDQRLAELRAEKSAELRKRGMSIGGRSLEENREIMQLRSRDSEVRGHEAAHMSAGGSYIRGGATFSYQKGPDGHEYATGGEVSIDTSPIPGKPAETIAKMQTVRAAALAPSEPSGADAAVAAAASQAMAEAAAEQAARNSQTSAYAAENQKAAGTDALPGSLIDIAV